MEEMVVLVDEQNTVLGTAPKATVHTTHTPLHRAFSVFLFKKSDMQFFVTQRANTKKTFPGVFTNSFCGHPSVNETPEEASIRRAKEELGISQMTIVKTIPYRYSCTDSQGIVENELCPVLIALTEEEPVLNPNEVEKGYWTDWKSFLKDQKEHPDIYSFWSKEEALLVDKELPSLFSL